MNRIELSGKIAIVTGGTSGIGRATVERLARSGAKTVVFDIADASPDASTSSPIARLHVDVTDEHAVDAGVERVAREHGTVDILVNCAGIAGPRIAVAACPLDVWRRVVEVNLTGTFLCCRAAARVMSADQQGRIINVASAAGKDGNPYSAHYSAAKAAVIALTKSLGRELANTTIRVNCVTPGAVDTPLLEGMDAERRAAAVAKIPIGRLAQPEEVAAMIAWLASDECSVSTGAVFDLSGGRSSY